MNKLLIICGPTATGKTDLGIKLAKKMSAKSGPAAGWNGEIISADSRQVYRYMDIGTGKDIPISSNLKSQISKLKLKSQNYIVGYRLVNDISIWLVDVCKPDQEFSVAHFVDFAKLVINDIWKRNKLPIVVGGTGFWIKALINGVESLNIPPDWELRQQLNNLTIEQLREVLKETCPERLRGMNQSDKNNPRRLIRAIEITKSQISKLKTQNYSSNLKIDKLLIIGLKTKDYQSLYKRIDKRVDKRIQQGAEKEMRELLLKGYSFKLPSFSATGYRVWQGFLDNKKNLEETVQRWKYDEHGLARRQLIFFRKDKRINWFDIDNKNWQKQIEIRVSQWYS